MFPGELPPALRPSAPYVRDPFLPRLRCPGSRPGADGLRKCLCLSPGSRVDLAVQEEGSQLVALRRASGRGPAGGSQGVGA